MINGIGKGGNGRIEANRSAPGQGVSADVHARNDSRKLGHITVGSLVSDIASSGAPIDGAKVAAIKQAIAEGRYPVNAERIADAMLALDLPE